METNSTEKAQVTIFAKLVDGQLVTTCVPEDDPDTLALILADGFKPYDDSAPMPSGEELQATVPAYSEDADRISLRWEIVEHSPEKVAAEIGKLKAELAATDYQVIKSYEYTLAKQKQPYDITAIHAERQAIRDRIAELEGII